LANHIIADEIIIQQIYFIREQKVTLDRIYLTFIMLKPSA